MILFHPIETSYFPEGAAGWEGVSDLARGAGLLAEEPGPALGLLVVGQLRRSLLRTLSEAPKLQSGGSPVRSNSEPPGLSGWLLCYLHFPVENVVYDLRALLMGDCGYNRF